MHEIFGENKWKHKSPNKILSLNSMPSGRDTHTYVEKMDIGSCQSWAVSIYLCKVRKDNCNIRHVVSGFNLTKSA